MRDPLTPISKLRGLGPKSAQMLSEVGVHTLEDLEELGSVLAYHILKHRFSDVSLNMLYGLESALRGVHWLSLSQEDKKLLRAEVDTAAEQNGL